jgi:hypothetical protein
VNETNLDKNINDPLIDRRDFMTLALSPKPGITLFLFICPFCYSVSAPPSNLLFTEKHRCACGATFHKLGYAFKTTVKPEH